ncbi:MAG: YHS domain-containing protein [Rhodopseudomonas palustris]|nr:YHS domain-containing protein [Rhodopseudomonas palustris]
MQLTDLPPRSSTTAASAIDPVCGMSVKIAGSAHRYDYQGITYHFCCAGCRSAFSADPARYLQPSAPTSGSCCGGAAAEACSSQAGSGCGGAHGGTGRAARLLRRPWRW